MEEKARAAPPRRRKMPREAVVHVLRQPSVTGVSRVCKPIEFSKSSSVYVDVVCSLNGNPVWFIVSGRNPSCRCCAHSPVTLRPSSVVLFFSNGLGDDVYQKLRCEFEAVDVKMEPLCYHELDLEEEWTDVVLGRLFPDACAVRIQVGEDGIEPEKDIRENRMGSPVSRNKCCEHSGFDPGLSLSSLVAGMKCWCCSLDDEVELQVGLMNQSWRDVEAKLVNFDTTAMVAIASGISNGRTEKLLATPEHQLRDRFKGNYDFVISQVIIRD
ncbi:hypothetical protein SASPL_158008 [Salvia splendens]|uniref:Uncharacterized protein n=1 Tax=Salvia splendens TaxID=180675 RepID=A0A8X8VTY8_SALSN|nr:hypothetical protein SASPL_158008 [Salvia splendens]